jgi:hypothetical protein
MDYMKRLDEIEARLPKDTIWQLADGGEFRSSMTTARLVTGGYEELMAGGPHPILDAAIQTIRSSDGSRLHELFAAVAVPVLEEHRIATPTSLNNAANPATGAAFEVLSQNRPEICPN